MTSRLLILISLFTIHHSAAAPAEQQRTTAGNRVERDRKSQDFPEGVRPAGSINASPPPNILLILSDDHAQHALSCYGNKHIQTPSLDRLAREGMRFNHALTPNSFCTPARAAVLTGKYSHKNGVTHLNQKFDGSQQTFPKMLQAAGYNTALFGKWHLLTQPTGFDHYCVMKMQGMPMNPGRLRTPARVDSLEPPKSENLQQGRPQAQGLQQRCHHRRSPRCGWSKSATRANPSACCSTPSHRMSPTCRPLPGMRHFLEDVTIPEPATLYDDYKGRTPEAIQKTMRSNLILRRPNFKKNIAEFRKQDPDITDKELLAKLYQIYIKGYYRLVKNVDDNVGRVLDYLDESGLAKNTIVIYTSDQGFSLGEHGFYNKQWMYEKPLHQPLLVRLPEVIKAGQVCITRWSTTSISPPPCSTTPACPFPGTSRDIPCAASWRAKQKKSAMLPTTTSTAMGTATCRK